MSIYNKTNYNNLKYKDLENRDLIIFNTDEGDLEYTVCTRYLSCDDYSNDYIFDILSVDKDEYADSAYGYSSNGGGWPESKERDYKALTRLVLKIFNDLNYESRLQDKDSQINRGDLSGDSVIRGRKGKASIVCGHLGYRTVIGK